MMISLRRGERSRESKYKMEENAMEKKQVSKERRSKELREQVIQDFLEHPEMTYDDLCRKYEIADHLNDSELDIERSIHDFSKRSDYHAWHCCQMRIAILLRSSHWRKCCQIQKHLILHLVKKNENECPANRRAFLFLYINTVDLSYPRCPAVHIPI